jgi:hypothetical protein
VDALKALQARTSEVRGQQIEWNKVKPMLDKLAASPDDSAAALAVGRFYLLTKGNWDKALPLFAKCSSDALKAAAAKELEAPKEAEAKADVGDLWWASSEKETGAMKAALQNRAVMWYADAVNELTGTRKIQVEKRLQAAATGTGSGGVAALSYKEGLIRSITVDQTLSSLHFLPNGRLCLAACNRAMLLIDLESGQKLRSISISNPAARVAFSMDGKRLAAFGEWGGAKCEEAAVWDLTSGAEISRYKPGAQQMHGVGFYADGRAVCIGGLPSSPDISLRQIQDGKILLPKPQIPWGVAQFSADGSIFSIGDSIVESKTAKTLRKLDIPPEGNWIDYSCLSRDKRFIACMQRLTVGHKPFGVCVYEAGSGKLVQTIKPLDEKGWSFAQGIALDPDGRRLVVTVGPQTRIYDVASGRELVRWDKTGGYCDVSPDGHFAIVNGANSKTFCLFGMPR